MPRPMSKPVSYFPRFNVSVDRLAFCVGIYCQVNVGELYMAYRGPSEITKARRIIAGISVDSMGKSYAEISNSLNVFPARIRAQHRGWRKLSRHQKIIIAVRIARIAGISNYWEPGLSGNPRLALKLLRSTGDIWGSKTIQ